MGKAGGECSGSADEGKAGTGVGTGRGEGAGRRANVCAG